MMAEELELGGPRTVVVVPGAMFEVVNVSEPYTCESACETHLYQGWREAQQVLPAGHQLGGPLGSQAQKVVVEPPES